MGQIRALVWKDLQVHGRAAALLLVGWPIGVRLLVLVVQSSPDAGAPGMPIVVTMVSLLLFVAVAAGLATMLVERERGKGTFAWLRTLPVSDAHIVAGKCATGLLLHVIGYVTWWAVLGRLAPALTVPQVVSVWCATLVVGAIPLVSQIASSGRVTSAAPVALVALGLLAGPALDRWPAIASGAAAIWNGSWEHVCLWAACGAIYALLVALACLRFHTQDTQMLVD